MLKRDEIIEMAMKSGCPRENAFVNFDILEEFAKLVEERTAAKERESCAKIAWNLEPDENGPIETAIRARGNKE